MVEFARRGISLSDVEPLLDGVVPTCTLQSNYPAHLLWMLPNGGSIELAIENSEGVTRLTVSAKGVEAPSAIGLRFGKVTGARQYLRNGYHSWDGSFFADPGTVTTNEAAGKEPDIGFAMTALLPTNDEGAVMLGFDRHDRFQTRFRFGGNADAMTIDVETLLDATGALASETLLIFDEGQPEAALARWSDMVATASPTLPRIPEKRISGWCSWYNLYAAINEENILEHLGAAKAYRDAHDVPLDIFLIDDGFTPEMGDWLDVKPQFPRGMKPLIGDIADAGFTPGLWIAPFMVGNRSKLFAEHPDWVVRERDTGEPLAQMKFYGEFRWHKRSEEYYILDITHPGAEAWIRQVFRTWAHDWGAGYFKTDFMFFGAEYGPDRAAWHQPGQSRIAIWRKMASIIREEIGDAIWLGCGCPLWASVGLVDAIRIGRDVGAKWSGEQSAESLLRDQATRNHAAGRLWQADPDCILLRERFHDLTDDQVRGLAILAGLSGGVLMTSDTLSELRQDRASLFDWIAGLQVESCSYPLLGKAGSDIIQHVRLADGTELEHVLDTVTGKSRCTDQNGNIVI